jgi:hypothetical protein
LEPRPRIESAALGDPWALRDRRARLRAPTHDLSGHGHRCDTRCGSPPSRGSRVCRAWEGHALRSRRSRDQGIAHDRRCVVETDAVRLAGVHHLKLPVRDIARSEGWYGRTLGYRRSLEFRDDEKLVGILMIHQRVGRRSLSGWILIGPRPLPDSITSSSVCPTRPQLMIWPRTWTASASRMVAFTRLALAGSCLSYTIPTGMRCVSTPSSITRRSNQTTSSGSMTPMNSAGSARGWSGRLPPLLAEPTPVTTAKTSDRRSLAPPESGMHAINHSAGRSPGL